MKKHLKPWSK